LPWYWLALVNPCGRLGQFHFALLACLIAFAHIYIYAKMADMPANEP
jgi:hypothetical protein